MSHGHILAANAKLLTPLQELIGTYVPPQPL
jgi:hypothetical protein